MANGREEVGAAWFINFFSFLNRTGSVRVGRFRHTKTRNRTEPNIFLNILTGLTSFFTGSVFLVNFLSVFSVKSVFRFFCSPLSISTEKRRRENPWKNIFSMKFYQIPLFHDFFYFYVCLFIYFCDKIKNTEYKKKEYWKWNTNKKRVHVT